MKVILDAGHGGFDFGATNKNRKEKDDNLALTLAVGKLLEQAGIPVEYTRTQDIYQSPYEKADIANASDADFFLSIHRNAADDPGTGSGVETLVFDETSDMMALADAINQNLETVGFENLGVIPRPDLVVLNKIKIPSLLAEVGFIDNDKDNKIFDENFNEIAQAIANAIIQSNPMTSATINSPKPVLYRVNVGVFRNEAYAYDLWRELIIKGYPAFIYRKNGYNFVQVGAYRDLNDAVRMEQNLRLAGYSTYITT